MRVLPDLAGCVPPSPGARRTGRITRMVMLPTKACLGLSGSDHDLHKVRFSAKITNAPAVTVETGRTSRTGVDT